jgi:hypothetical protein
VLAPAPEPALHPFAYALVRVVPRVERGEAMNVGIILLCRPKRYLGARIALDEARLWALDPACDPADVRPHLEAIERIAAGDPAGGPIASLSQAERYHWLVAPSSTIIQPAEAHTGLTADPAATLEHLFATLVLAPAPAGAGSPAATGLPAAADPPVHDRPSQSDERSPE